jgi:hypothetical protein
VPEIPQAVAPTLTPPPEMNPRIAGEPGAAMANAAEQMGSVAEMGFHVAQKMQEAQETVDVKMGEVGIDKLEADAHAAMGKATTPEQMQDIQRGFEEQAQEAVNSQKNPKVSRALQFYGAHKSIGIQDLATVRQAKVITENDLAANDMLGTKYSGDWVLAAANGGDTTMAENDERILLASSVKHGTMTQEQADAHYDKWLRTAKMGTIEALANSPKPDDRQAIIAQLKSGRGTLVDGMDLAERNNALTVAEKADRELTNLAESHDLNGAANSVLGEYKEHPTLYPNVEAKEGFFDSASNLINAGIYTVNSATGEKEPDWVKGGKVKELLKSQFADELTSTKKEVNKIGDSVVDMLSGNDKNRFEKATTLLRSKEQMFEQTGNTDSYRSWMDYVDKRQREIVSEARAGVGLQLSQISLERQLQNEKDTSALQDFNMSLPTHGYTNDEIIRWGAQKKLSTAAIDKAIALNGSAQKSPEYQSGLQNVYSAVWKPTKPSGTVAADTTDVWDKYNKQIEWTKQWAWRAHELYDGFVNQGMGFPLASENAKKQVVREQAAGKIDQMLGRSQGSSQSQLAVGTIRPGDGGNYRFKGGDQYDQKNWEKVVK